MSLGPSNTIHSFQGYEINGFTFYTVAQDSKSTNQKSVVRVDTFDSDGTKRAYYGYIDTIWELDYGPLKVPVFRCKWVKIPKGLKVDKDGITTVDLNDVGYEDEPFVLARSVKQCFYVVDPSNKKRHVVMPGKRRIVGVDNIVDEDEYD